MAPRVVVASVGTYHLPFDRFSDWLQRWIKDQDDVRLVVQHGPSKPVVGAENVDTFRYEDLMSFCRSADVVVLQGGAGGVMDMRSIGVTPIVVPRVPGGGEVVDDHQLVFCDAMERIGLVRCARSYEDLAELLDVSLRERDRNLSGQQPGTPGADVVRETLRRPIDGIPLSTVGRRALHVLATQLRSKLTRSGR